MRTDESTSVPYLHGRILTTKHAFIKNNTSSVNFLTLTAMNLTFISTVSASHRDIFPRMPWPVQWRSASWRSWVTAIVHLSVHCCNVTLSTVLPTAQYCAGCSHLHTIQYSFIPAQEVCMYRCKLATFNTFRFIILSD